MFVANRYSIVELSYPHVKYKIVQHLTPFLLFYASSLSLISTEYHTNRQYGVAATNYGYGAATNYGYGAATNYGYGTATNYGYG